MKNLNKASVRKWLDILLSISFAIAGICLIGACLSIYYSGDQPYSREAVAEAFAKICIPVYICLILTVVSVIWQLISPAEAKKQKPRKDNKLIYDRLLSKKDLSKCNEDILSSANAEYQKRQMMNYIRAVVLVISSAVFLSYALNGNNFHQSEINSSMIRAMLVLLPCLAVGLGISVFTFYYNEKSMIREIELLKKAPDADTPKTAKATTSERTVLYVKIALICLAVICAVFGFLTGGTADVLTKAINICTECIGLG